MRIKVTKFQVVASIFFSSDLQGQGYLKVKAKISR